MTNKLVRIPMPSKPKSTNGVVVHQADSAILSPLDDEDVDVAISEILALMPRNTATEDKGTFVRQKLYQWGLRIVREE